MDLTNVSVAVAASDEGESEGSVGVAGLISLLLVSGLSCIAFAGLAPVLPQISEHFSDTPGADAVARSLITVAGGAMAVGAPIGGVLAARFSERAVLIGALLIIALAGAAGAILDNIWLVLSTRVLVGLAHAAASVAALTVIANSLSPARRNKWIGFNSVAAAVGTIITMPIAGYLGAIDWRLVFLLHFAAIPVLLLILFLVRSPNSQAHDPEHGEALTKFPLALMFLAVACGGVTASLTPFLPFHLEEIRTGSSQSVALAITAMTLASASTAFCYGWIRRYLTPPIIFTIAFFAIGSAVLLFLWVGTVEATIGCMLLAGVGVGLTAPNFFAIAATAPPADRARRLGWGRGAYYSAPLISQVLLEPIAADHGAGGAFMTIAAFAVIGGALMFISRRGAQWRAHGIQEIG